MRPRSAARRRTIAFADAHLPLGGQEVEARQVGDDRVRGQRVEQGRELPLETHRLERGDVVAADAHGHDVGVELGELRQLIANGKSDRRTRDTEVHEAHRGLVTRSQRLREHADVAVVGAARADALRCGVSDRDIENVAGLRAALAPVLRVHGDALREHDPPVRPPVAEVPRLECHADGGGHGEGQADDEGEASHPSTVSLCWVSGRTAPSGPR